MPPAANVPVYPQPGSAAEPLRPAPRRAVPVEEEEFGVACQLCGSRIYVRRTQIGETVKCPDCHSRVIVEAPTKRKQTQPTEYDESELFKLSEPVELPSTIAAPPETYIEGTSPAATPATRTPAGAGRPVGGGTAQQQAARRLLEKARAEQAAEEAEERERSAERFTEGLLGFFADPHALGRLALLALWFELGVTLFRWAAGMKISERLPAIFSQASSLAVAVATALVGITFLVGVAACGLALVKDSSQGLRKVEHWPGLNVLAWGRGIFYIVNAGFLAALPGAALGIALGLCGVTGTILYTAAASFVGLFPPMLLSMLESNSVFSPFDKDVWASIRERPDPWRLSYLITGVVTLGGLFAFVFGLAGDFSTGLVAAVVLVAAMMVYFRTLGWLMFFLAGRNEKQVPGQPVR